eukprot:gene25139-1653_t
MSANGKLQEMLKQCAYADAAQIGAIKTAVSDIEGIGLFDPVETRVRQGKAGPTCQLLVLELGMGGVPPIYNNPTASSSPSYRPETKGRPSKVSRYL